MRGVIQDQGGLFSYISLEERVPDKHPLRKIRELVRAVLVDLNKDFAAVYADEGRPSSRAFRGAAGTIAERIVAASVLRPPVRATIDGTTGLQSFVSLVCWAVA